MTDAHQDEGAGPDGGARIAQEMRLRPERPRVTRLSRKVLMGLGTIAAVGIGSALFFALQPRHLSGGSELYNTDNRSTPDGLANLPRDYTGLPRSAPQLGPPLPGDLGRPIVNAGAPAPGIPTAAAPPDHEQQRIAQEREAARTSHLFATTNTSQIARAAAPVAPLVLDGTAAPVVAASNDLTARDYKLAFLNGAVDRRTVSPDRVQAPASPYVLQAGAVIPAALITGLRSDLPGQVTAQVTEDVYDSPSSRSCRLWPSARARDWSGRPRAGKAGRADAGALHGDGPRLRQVAAGDPHVRESVVSTLPRAGTPQSGQRGRLPIQRGHANAISIEASESSITLKTTPGNASRTGWRSPR